jgi:probable rRNA maturation factor
MILNRQRTVRVARRPLEKFLQRVRSELGLSGTDVTVCLVSDAEIARMNEEFRKKRGPTDVLSFPAERAPRVPRGKKELTQRTLRAQRARRRGGESREADGYLGDIAIAPETAKRYAEKKGRTLNSELRVLILHGVLHLLGYDHETDRGQMNRVEHAMRRKLGLA